MTTSCRRILHAAHTHLQAPYCRRTSGEVSKPVLPSWKTPVPSTADAEILTSYAQATQQRITKVVPFRRPSDKARKLPRSTCNIVPSSSLSHTPASIPTSTSCASIVVAEACLVPDEKHSSELTSCRLQDFSVCLLARLSSSRSVRYSKQEAEMQSFSLLHKCAEMTFVKLLIGR